jgi:hypothetical protein
MLSRPAKKKKWDFPEVKKAVFSILHAPPSDFGFNRISWRMEDIVVVKRAEGVGLCKEGVREIIRHALTLTRSGRRIILRV